LCINLFLSNVILLKLNFTKKLSFAVYVDGSRYKGCHILVQLVYDKSRIHRVQLFPIKQTFWNSSDRAGRKSQGPAILPSMLVRVSDKTFCLCILFCTGNRKCNWYAGTITVNSELDSASNDIYFLNMQLFPW
jgi:hypothetical protein